MKSITFLKGTTGLNNVVDAIRIGHNEETGIVDLGEAYNINIDDSGRLSRRKGFYTTSRTESVHSMFAEKEYCLYMSGDSLYRLNPDYSRTGLRSSMTIGAVVDYAYANREVYYTNGFEIGIVRDNTSWGWAKPTTYYGVATFRQFSDPPLGHLVCYYNGRMFIAQDNIVWFSEPYNYGAFDLARNYWLFPSRVKMLRAVSDGLFVSDSFRIYSLLFNKPDECKQTVVYDYPAIEGSAAIGDATNLQLPESVTLGLARVAGPVVLCTTNNGICVGLQDGIFKNMTQDKLVCPTANKATAVIKDNTYICLLQE
jgi:hypothetical protein